MIFKVIYHLAGGHYHCSLFSAARADTTFAKCGDFVIRKDEFDPLRNAMSGVAFYERVALESER